RRHTRFSRDWSSDVCSSDLIEYQEDDSQFNSKGVIKDSQATVENPYENKEENRDNHHPTDSYIEDLMSSHEDDNLSYSFSFDEEIGRASCRERVWNSVNDDT